MKLVQALIESTDAATAILSLMSDGKEFTDPREIKTEEDLKKAIGKLNLTEEEKQDIMTLLQSDE